MSTLNISNEICWDYRMIKKAVENITKLRTWNKGKDFKNLFLRDECKLKRVIAKQPLLITSIPAFSKIWTIFEKARIEAFKKNKRRRILWELDSIKKIPLATSSHKSNYFKASKLGQIIHANCLSKVIFTEESWVKFDGPDGWTKWWILSNSDVPQAKWR